MNLGLSTNSAHSTLTAPIVLAMALLGALCGCSGSGSQAAASRPPGPPTVPVTVTAAAIQDLPVFLVGLGSATASNTVSIKSRVDGQLVQVNFKEGQQVKRGQLLAVLDSRPFQVQLEQAQAILFRDQAQLKDAKLNSQRFKDLLKESGAVSQQQVDTQAALVDQFEGAIRNDQAQIDNAKLQITYCHITAPISGRVGLRLVDAGNIIHASDPNPLLVITQLQPMGVLFSLPEDQLPAVQRHMKSGPLRVDAYSRDDITKIATGQLLTLDNEIDQTTGTGRLKAIFANKDNALFSNQFVNIHLLLEQRKNAIVIPVAAIQKGPQGNFVYAVNADKTVEIRPVTIALSQGNLAAIGQGLAAGDLVVTDGQDKLQAGSKVEAHAATQPSDPATGANVPMGQPPAPRPGAMDAAPNGQTGHRRGNHRP